MKGTYHMKRFKEIGIVALFCAAILLGGVRLPGDSGYHAAAQNTATWREMAQGAVQQAQAITDTTETAQAPTEPHSVEFRGMAIYEGQEFTGEITHYCDCKKCCGPNAQGITADGTVLADLGPDDLPAVSCNWLPFDVVIEYNGQQRRVADRGGKGLNTVGIIDEYTPEGHQAALDKGRLREVTIKVVSLP